MCWSTAFKTAALGVGLLGPLSGDFPAARRWLSIQGCGAATDSARHRLVLASVEIGLQRVLCVIFIFLEVLSVIVL